LVPAWLLPELYCAVPAEDPEYGYFRTFGRYFEDIALQKATSTRWFVGLLSQVKKHKLDPYEAARKLLRKSLTVA